MKTFTQIKLSLLGLVVLPFLLNSCKKESKNDVITNERCTAIQYKITAINIAVGIEAIPNATTYEEWIEIKPLSGDTAVFEEDLTISCSYTRQSITVNYSKGDSIPSRVYMTSDRDDQILSRAFIRGSACENQEEEEISGDDIVSEDLEAFAPTFTLGSATDISTNSITVSTNIVEGGDPVPTIYGLAYATENDTEKIIRKVKSNGDKAGFTETIGQLNEDTQYYIWLYSEQNGYTHFSETSLEVRTKTTTPASGFVFDGTTYEGVEGGYLDAYTANGKTIQYFYVNRVTNDIADFYVNVELSYTGEGLPAGTYTFNGTEKAFDNNTNVVLDNSLSGFEATGGTIEVSIDNGIYTLDMNFTTAEGNLTGSFTFDEDF